MVIAAARETVLPAALLDRLAGAALAAGVDAGLVAAALEGGPHAAARALEVAAELLDRAGRLADGEGAGHG